MPGRKCAVPNWTRGRWVRHPIKEVEWPHGELGLMKDVITVTGAGEPFDGDYGRQIGPIIAPEDIKWLLN